MFISPKNILTKKKQLYSSQSFPKNFVVLLFLRNVANLIGKKAENVMKLANEANATIKVVPDETKTLPFQVCNITGDPEHMTHASKKSILPKQKLPQHVFFSLSQTCLSAFSC